MSEGEYVVKKGKYVKTKQGRGIVCPYCSHLHDEDVPRHGDSIFCRSCKKIFVIFRGD